MKHQVIPASQLANMRWKMTDIEVERLIGFLDLKIQSHVSACRFQYTMRIRFQYQFKALSVRIDLNLQLLAGRCQPAKTSKRSTFFESYKICVAVQSLNTRTPYARISVVDPSLR